MQNEMPEFLKVARITRPAEDLRGLIRAIWRDENVRAAVIFFDTDPAAGARLVESGVIEDLRNLRVPVVAAVNGYAGTAVTEIVRASHLSFAGASARFARLEEGSETDDISAAEALEAGLINSVFADEDVENEALLLAKRIAEMSPAAVRACLEAVCRGFEMDLDDGLKLEAELFARIFASEDMREGTAAFLEKRKAIFSGK